MRGRPRRLAISFLCSRAFLDASRFGSSCRSPTNSTRQLRAALAAYRINSCTNFVSEELLFIVITRLFKIQNKGVCFWMKKGVLGFKKHKQRDSSWLSRKLEDSDGLSERIAMYVFALTPTIKLLAALFLGQNHMPLYSLGSNMFHNGLLPNHCYLPS